MLEECITLLLLFNVEFKIRSMCYKEIKASQMNLENIFENS